MTFHCLMNTLCAILRVQLGNCKCNTLRGFQSTDVQQLHWLIDSDCAKLCIAKVVSIWQLSSVSLE